LRTFAANVPSIDVLRVEGGWSAVVQVPQLRGEEALVLELLERDNILVHPGYFFDFAREAYLVLSLLIDPAEFDLAIPKLLKRAAGAPTRAFVPAHSARYRARKGTEPCPHFPNFARARNFFDDEV